VDFSGFYAVKLKVSKFLQLVIIFVRNFYSSTFSFCTPTSTSLRESHCEEVFVRLRLFLLFDDAILPCTSCWPFLLNAFLRNRCKITSQWRWRKDVSVCNTIVIAQTKKKRQEQALYLHKLLACRERRVLMTLRFIFIFCLLFLLLSTLRHVMNANRILSSAQSKAATPTHEKNSI
jgi:hypothetical protein